MQKQRIIKYNELPDTVRRYNNIMLHSLQTSDLHSEALLVIRLSSTVVCMFYVGLLPVARWLLSLLCTHKCAKPPSQV